MNDLMTRCGQALAIALMTLGATFAAAGQTDQLEQLERQYGARIGIDIIRLSDSARLYSRRAQELFVPASTVKILSTGAALRKHGRDFRFATSVYAVGEVQADTLRGGLLIVGSGDPSIASRFIPSDTTRFHSELIEALHSSGIHHVDGGLYIDASMPTDMGVHPSWMVEDIGKPYGAGWYGFNYRDNALSLPTIIEGRGRRAQSRVLPSDETAGFRISSTIRPAKRRSVQVELMPFFPEIRLLGTLPSGGTKFSLRTANPDPAQTAALDLKRRLERAGVSVRKEPTRSYTGYEREGLPIHTYYSAPLDTLCLMTNHRSINMYAEAITATLANEGTPGKALEQYWRTLTGLGEEAIRLCDGSGLSRNNALTPEAMSRILVELFGGHSPHDGALIETLPQAGREGTVRHLMKSDDLTAYLKSGTMRGVSCYAGYIFHDGEWYCLTYFANGFPSASLARTALTGLLRRVFTLEIASTGTEPLPEE